MNKTEAYPFSLQLEIAIKGKEIWIIKRWEKSFLQTLPHLTTKSGIAERTAAKKPRD